MNDASQEFPARSQKVLYGNFFVPVCNSRQIAAPNPLQHKAKISNDAQTAYGCPYDGAGNHNSVTRDGTTQNRTHNTDNELVSVDGDNTTRAAKGNTTEAADGNEYFYDLDNRIYEIRMDNGDKVELQYDALGRRVHRKEGTDEKAFLWWGDQECSEHVSGAGQPVIQNDLWAHPTALNKICARAVEGDKNDIEWYHKTYLDHVYAVSDDNGSIDEHYRYSAFGEVEIYSPTGGKLAVSAIDNEVLWNSRRYDFDTELYYYKYRHYKADIGRWLGRDPIEEDGWINLYGFVENEPVGYWDRHGLEVRVKTTFGRKHHPHEPMNHDEIYEILWNRRNVPSKDENGTLLTYPRGKTIPFFEPNANISQGGYVADGIVMSYKVEYVESCKKWKIVMTIEHYVAHVRVKATRRGPKTIH